MRGHQWMERLAASMTAGARFLEGLYTIMRDMDEGQGHTERLLGDLTESIYASPLLPPHQSLSCSSS